MTKLFLALVLSASCGIPCDHAFPGHVFKPVAYHLPSDPVTADPHSFSPGSTSWHSDALDAAVCSYPDAVIVDPQLGELRGSIRTEGTGDWSNGLTSHAEPVFVGTLVPFDGGPSVELVTAVFVIQ